MSTIVGIFGVALVLLPFYIFENFGIPQFIIVCIGVIFLGVSRANSLSRISGKDSVGDEFVYDLIKWIKKKLFK